MQPNRFFLSLMNFLKIRLEFLGVVFRNDTLKVHFQTYIFLSAQLWSIWVEMGKITLCNRIMPSTVDCLLALGPSYIMLLPFRKTCRWITENETQVIQHWSVCNLAGDWQPSDLVLLMVFQSDYQLIFTKYQWFFFIHEHTGFVLFGFFVFFFLILFLCVGKSTVKRD